MSQLEMIQQAQKTLEESFAKKMSILRKQINEYSNIVDNLEMRSRRKALIFLRCQGVRNRRLQGSCPQHLLNTMGLKDIASNSIKVCHRLGMPNKDRPRPILVKFADVAVKSIVWRAKASLKTSSITLKEFLTRTRQTVFTRARLHFGIRACWTQDGVIIIKPSSDDGDRHKITSVAELNSLVARYPKKSGGEMSASSALSAKR
ncbi:hypothetical protein ACJJTC_003947 [Scirpophaga incertulas]